MNSPPPQHEPPQPATEAWMRLVIAQLPAVLWTTDLNLRGTSLLGAGLAKLGLKTNQLLGVSLLDYMERDPAHPAIAGHYKALEGEASTFTHAWLGNIYQTHLEPLRDADGKIIGVIGLGLDITELHTAHTKLRDLNAELEQRVADRTRDLETANQELTQNKKFIDRVITVAPAIIYVYDLVERCNVYVNDQLRQLLGYSLEDSKRPGTRLFDDNFHPDDAARVAATIDGHLYRADGEIVTHEYRLRHANGTWRWLRSRDVVFARDEHGRPRQVLGLAVDITEQRQAEASLEGEQHLLRRLLALQNRERRIVAYELHDGFVQQVIGAQMRLAGLAGWTPEPNAELLAEVDDISRILQQAIGEARRLIGEMRPMVIDAHGLVAAIEDLVHDLAGSTGMAVEFHHDVSFQRLAPEFEGNVFRIVQEALSNVRRHSQATQSHVRLTQQAHKVYVEVQDNGIGFDPASVPKNHFGLEGIRERARLFGGTSQVVSSEGNGTTILVELPLDATPADALSEKPA